MYNRIDIKKIYNRLRSSARRRGIEFDLTLDELNGMTIPLTCPVLGIPLRINSGGVSDDSISFDRIDNRIGYRVDNLAIISYRANRIKNELGLNDLDRLIEYIIYEQEKRL